MNGQVQPAKVYLEMVESSFVFVSSQVTFCISLTMKLLEAYVNIFHSLSYLSKICIKMMEGTRYLLAKIWPTLDFTNMWINMSGLTRFFQQLLLDAFCWSHWSEVAKGNPNWPISLMLQQLQRHCICIRLLSW